MLLDDCGFMYYRSISERKTVIKKNSIVIYVNDNVLKIEYK